MAQLSALADRSLLSVGTVRDRCYGHAEGTAAEDEQAGRCSDGHDLNRRVRSVLVDQLPGWQGSFEPRHAPGWLGVLPLVRVEERESSVQAKAL
jgi:hypothetical protein